MDPGLLRVTTQIDVEKFSRVMGELHDAMVGHGDVVQDGLAASLVEDEGRRLIRQVVRFIPPQSERQGKNAIQRDLVSLMSEGEPQLLDRVRMKHGTVNIDTWVSRSGKDKGKVHLLWDNLVATGNMGVIKRLHYSYKNARGHVRSEKGKPGDRGGVWKSRVVVPQGKRAAYIEDLQRRVGRMKAAWCALAERLGLKVEPWVKRHVPSPFAIGDASGMSDGKFPTLKFGSRAAGVALFRHQIEEAVRVRTTAMTRRLRLVLSDFNEDLARNMKLRAKEKAAAYNREAEHNDYGSSGISY
jgi:hypothetical protein